MATVQEAIQKARDTITKLDGAPPLWPEPYRSDDPDTCWQFVRGLRTWNEADKQVMPFPDQQYLRVVIREWYAARDAGESLIVEKSRRLIVSYLMGAIELFQCGLSRNKNLIVHMTNPDAMREVWRIWQMYTDLQRRQAGWKLPVLAKYGNENSEGLEQLMFANGSTVNCHHQDAGALQGSGFSNVRVEELSKYMYPSAVYGQAGIVCQGSAEGKGGFVYCITNAAPSADWQELKGKTVAREILGLVSREG